MNKRDLRIWAVEQAVKLAVSWANANTEPQAVEEMADRLLAYVENENASN